MKKGLILIYTGNGKGKTTAALGQALRARGHGIKVCWISFFKDYSRIYTGEAKMLKKIGVKLYSFAPRHPHFFKSEPRDRITKECDSAVECVRKILGCRQCGMLVLDELNIALRDRYLKVDDVVSILKSLKGNVDVVITGRGAPKKLREYADTVSNIKELKHHYRKGVKGRKGIEY